ncbi:copper amine oxidase N-terminal domain-containing protein [bacterium]|nr:copper amine oxidase N-terminal domain-containing protein [bacterium]
MRKFFAMVAFFMVFFSSFSGLNKVASLSFNLKATPECGYILLEWEPVTGADRYYIYRGPGEGLEYETPLTDFPIEETSYQDVTDLVVNQKYCYYVKAVNQEGREFLQSTEACALFTCQEEVPEIGDEDCRLILKYQVGNFYYWRNENQKGPMDVEPVLLNSRVLASARYLAEEVGATVGWDDTTRTVSIVTLDGVKIQMQIGNPIMLVNGQQVQIDPNNKAVTPIIYKNRTMLPFRALAYNLGATGPDDIVWLGDIRTAVLTFNDGNCNWICGCYKPYVSPAAAVTTYQFYKDCDDTNRMNVTIPPTMKDKLHGWLFADYIKQHPNSPKWCVEIRLDKDGSVIAWRARPDQYPDCCKPKECKWICGCVIRWTEAPNNHISIYFSVNCKGDNTELINFIVPMSLKDTSLGLTLLEYFRKYGNQNYWCLEICVDANRKVVQWKATPERYPDCCKPEECKEICGCILKVEPIAGSNNIQVSFSPNCDPTNVLNLVMLGNILDSQFGISISDYIKKYPNQKYWCATFCIGPNNKVVKWTATPEKYPDCCKPLPTKSICGCIVRMATTPDSNGNYSVNISTNCQSTDQQPFDLVIYFPATLLDLNKNKNVYTNFYTDLGGPPAKLCFEAEINSMNVVVKWWARPEKTPPDCCKDSCKWVCGCFEKYDSSSKGGTKIWFNPNCNSPSTSWVEYFIPWNLEDLNHQFTIGEYIDQYPSNKVKYWCLEVCVDNQGNVVQWKATPERYPDCCKPVLDCKEVCGCIISVDPIAGTDKTEIVFSPNCDPTNILNLVMLGNILDSQFGISISDYIKKYPNQKYWCATMCIIEDTEIIKWTATPEKYPDCCKEEGGRIIAYFPEKCIAGTSVLIYNTAGEVVWKGEPNGNGIIDTGCKLKCPDVYTIVPVNQNCTFTPAKQEVKVPCCPEKAEIKFDCNCEPLQKLCCCVVRMTIDPDNNGNYSVYLKKDCSTGDPVYDLVLMFPSTLLDTQLGLTILQYYQSIPPLNPPKMGCIEVAYNASNQVVSWAAYPDRSPCCEEKGGRLVVNIPTKCIKGTTVYVYDVTGAVVWSGNPNSDGLIDTGCKLKCPVTYVVVPKNETCTFTPAKQEVKVPCCPEKAEIKFDCAQKKGRVLVNIPKDCIQGSTLVWVFDVEPTATAKPLGAIEMDNNYQFDSECTLECGKTYWLMPQNEKCKFYPVYQKVTLPCCPEYAKVDFKCECETPKGRIRVSLPKNCMEGTKVLIYEGTSNLVATLTVNDLGYFDSDCTLKCGTYYTIIPKNEKCKFSPESQYIKTFCCPEINTISFQCDCQTEKARIVCNMPANCAANTTVYVYDAAGNLAVTLTVNAVGAFDTGCVLKCSTNYTVVPKSEKCKFYPESQSVQTGCCPETTTVAFKCECESATARIIITVPTTCSASTTIYVYEGEYSSNKRSVLSLSPDRSGKCDTGCVLKCNTLYTIVPKNANCTFYPATMPVKTTCCPEAATVAFKCECEGPGSIPPEEKVSPSIRQPRCVFNKEES